MENISEIHDINKVIRQPCDVQYWLGQGDLLKAMIAIQQDYMDAKILDNAGFNLLHYASTFNQFEVMVRLIEHFKIDVNILSKTQQTPLMLASTSGSFKSISYLIQKGAHLNSIDGVNFNAILYAMKSNKMRLVFYLIYKGVDYQIRDLNGCGLVHWSAYLNNVYLLQLLSTLGFELNETDKQGYTPFLRAVYNQSYDSLQFLINHDPDTIPVGFDVNKLRSQCLKQLIRNQILEQFNLPWSKAWFKRIFLANSLIITRIFLVLTTVALYYHYITGVIWRTYYDDSLFGFHVVLNFFVFAYIPYIQYFSEKVPTAKNFIIQSQYQTSNSSRDISQSFNSEDLEDQFSGQTKQRRLGVNSNINFKFMNEFLDKHKKQKNLGTNNFDFNDEEDEDQEEKQGILQNAPQNQNFITPNPNEKISIDNQIVKTPFHKFAQIVQEGLFKEADSFNFDQICPICLIERPDRTFHCYQCKMCVPEFSHHSMLFNQCISLKNYSFYYFLISIQFLLLFLLNFLTVVGYWDRLTSYRILALLEIIYLIIDDSFISLPYLHAGLYVYGLWMLLLSSFYFFMETYCVFNNLTRKQFYSKQKCYYLYQEIFIDYQGQKFTYYKNKYDEGFIQNFCQRIL